EIGLLGRTAGGRGRIVGVRGPEAGADQDQSNGAAAGHVFRSVHGKTPVGLLSRPRNVPLPVRFPVQRRKRQRRGRKSAPTGMSCGKKWRRGIAYTQALRRISGSAMTPNTAYGRLRAATRRAAFALLCCLAGTAGAADPGVLRATLANGLRVVIVRNALAPVVA